MFRNVRSEAPMGGPTLFWGLMLSVSTICIWSTYGESKYLGLNKYICKRCCLSVDRPKRIICFTTLFNLLRKRRLLFLPRLVEDMPRNYCIYLQHNQREYL